MKLFFLLLTLISISAGANSFITNYCNIWLRAHGDQTNIQPHLNVDKVYQTIEKWRTGEHRNELEVINLGIIEGEEIIRINLPSTNPEAKKVLITAGVHGDEPFGVTALLEFIEKSIYNRTLRAQYDFVFMPMLNPAGLKMHTRRNLQNIDLNRNFSAVGGSNLSQLVGLYFKHEKFEVAIDLHGAVTREKFFIINNNASDQEISERALAKIDPELVLNSEDGNYPGKVRNSMNPSKFSYVLISPGVTISSNPGTLKSYFNKSLKATHSFTFEYPGQITTFARQTQYVKLIEGMLEAVDK